MTALIALLLPVSATAAPEPATDDTLTTAVFDTPAPNKKPRKTPKPNRPDRTLPPTVAPTLVLGAAPVSLPPAREAIVVGYREPGVLGQLPLLLAQLKDYYGEAGFGAVTVVEVNDTLRDLKNGDLDFAVIPSRDAFKAFRDDPSVRAVAGYQNYGGKKGRFGGDLLVARPGLIADGPTTIIAFLSAYIRALQDLSDPGSAAEALSLIQAGDLAVQPNVAQDWEKKIAAFAPFDGGFGALAEEGGIGELAAYLANKKGKEPALNDFIAAQTLNIAQALLELPSNPDAGLVGVPTLTDISIGLQLSDESPSPVVVADAAGYFIDAGFETVEIMDVEQPLLGLLNGGLDFVVVDAVDAAEGASQGLPLAAIAGHQNYAADGTYGGDLVLATTDLLDTDSSTATAFLIAYLQGLNDLKDSVNAAGFAPHDGGFGVRDEGGGTAELGAYLAQEMGQEPDLDGLIDSGTLEFAQAWWGLPANPTDAPSDAPEEEAA
ncbi:MAG: hypothetical protein ACC726_14145 [Chloroflexota bacterium]